MDRQRGISGAARFGRRLVSILAPGMMLSGLCWGEPETARLSVDNRQLSQHRFQEFRIGGGLHYFFHFPGAVPPIPIYPGVQWVYPCFPFVSCVVQQQYRKYDRRDRQRLPRPRPVFDPETAVTDEAMDMWRAGLRPPVEPFRTDERDIVPEFLDHSLIRPEYEATGSVLPEFSSKNE